MKYDLFEKQDNMEVRNAQIVFMGKVLNWHPNKIKDYVDLALGTIRIYIKKFEYLLEQAKEWFDLTAYTGEIRQAPCAYILEFFNEKDQKMFLKVGKTKHITTRLKQLITEYKAKRVEIKQIYYTKSENYAEIVESALREHYQNIVGSGYIKLDRFKNVCYSFLDLKTDENLQKIIEICV